MGSGNTKKLNLLGWLSDTTSDHIVTFWLKPILWMERFALLFPFWLVKILSKINTNLGRQWPISVILLGNSQRWFSILCCKSFLGGKPISLTSNHQSKSIQVFLVTWKYKNFWTKSNLWSRPPATIKFDLIFLQPIGIDLNLKRCTSAMTKNWSLTIK